MAMSKERLVFISTGKINASQKYEQFTKNDLEKMSAATGFVLTPTTDYNAYKTSYSEFITAVAAQAAVLPSGKAFYVGLPVINASDSYVYSSDDYKRLRDFIIVIYGKYASDSRFKGFYFTNERVFGTVSVSSPTSNAMVKLMNDLAYVIRNDPNSKIYKEFIWAPYLGYNYTYYKTNQNLGIVANRTNIFNTVYLQSAYYFTPDRGEWNASTRMGIPEKNLELAVKCAQQNKVYNYTADDDRFVISSNEVGGTKTSSTKIAIDMEAEDGLRWNTSKYRSYYEKECAAFAPLITGGTCPFVFYAGSYNGIIKANLCQSIQAFYLNGGCKIPT